MPYELVGEGYRGRFAEALDHADARELLAAAPDLMARAQPVPAASWKHGVGVVDTPLGPAVVKDVARRKPTFVRRRRATRLFDLALRLGATGAETAQPWAALLPRSRGPALFLAEFVRLPTLSTWLRVGAPGDRAQVGEALAHTVARLHRGGLRHRDLKGANVLLDPGDPPRVVLLDLDGVRARWEPLGPYPVRVRARDLARLRLSLGLAPRAEVFAQVWEPLLACYAARMGDGASALDGPSRLWAERHAEENRRRGRPVV